MLPIEFPEESPHRSMRSVLGRRLPSIENGNYPTRLGPAGLRRALGEQLKHRPPSRQTNAHRPPSPSAAQATCKRHASSSRRLKSWGGMTSRYYKTKLSIQPHVIYGDLTCNPFVEQCSAVIHVDPTGVVISKCALTAGHLDSALNAWIHH